MTAYMLFLAVFWTIWVPFIAYDPPFYPNGGPWCNWWVSTTYFCVLINANGMLGHAARYSMSLRAIPMILIRIACLAGVLGLIGNYIFWSTQWWHLLQLNWGWVFVFYIWLASALNMIPMVAIAWIALRPPHSNHLHAVVVETQQPVVYQQ